MSLVTNTIAYWKYDDNNGPLVNDVLNVSPGTWNGTLGSQWTSGKLGFAGNFNGTDNHVDVPSASIFQGLSAVSITFWFNVANNGGLFQKFLFKNSVYDIGINSSGNVFAEIVGVFNLGAFNATVYWDSAWHFFALTYDGANLVGYIDGVQAITHAGTGSTATSANVLTMGYNQGNGHEFLFGKLDEVGMWGRGLSSTEVTTLYSAGRGLQYPFGLLSTSTLTASSNTSPAIIIRNNIVGY